MPDFDIKQEAEKLVIEIDEMYSGSMSNDTERLLHGICLIAIPLAIIANVMASKPYENN